MAPGRAPGGDGLSTSDPSATASGVSSTDRRGFLRRAALAGGALLLPGGGLLTSVGCGPSRIARRTDHYFLFYFMMGGWDLVLTTEPVPPKGYDVWIPYDKGDVVEAGGFPFGPAFKPLLPFAAKTAVLRGIYVDALNHPQARVRMCTGSFKPHGPRPELPSVQAILAEKVGHAYQIPNLSSDSLRPATFRGPAQDERLEPVRVSSVEMLKSLVGWRGGVSESRRDVEAVLRAKDAMTVARYQDAKLARSFRTYADLARDTLDGDYKSRVDELGGDLPFMPRTSKNARLAVEAIKNDLAPVVTVGTGEFDSHTRGQYAAHPAAVLRGMRTVADIAQGLEDVRMPGGKTLLDHTTIVVTSEFSRAPNKNELGGKHHWSANSMLFIGKGIRRTADGPTVVGGCDDGVHALPMNPNNGSFKRGAEVIEMQHGLASVLAMAGIDPLPHFGPYDPILPLLS